MSCDLTLGRLESCKDNVGGIKAIYFFNYGGITPVFDADEDAVTELGTATAFKYELKSDENTYSENIVSDRNAGTTHFEQNLAISLKGLSQEDQKEIRLLSVGRPHIVVHARNGEAFVAGIEEGMDVTGGTSTSIGGAYGDMVGYMPTFQGRERKPANWIVGATPLDPFAGMTTPPTITEGV